MQLHVDNVVVSGNSVSSSNGDLEIQPQGNGSTYIDGMRVKVGDLQLEGNSVVSTATDADIRLTPHGSGRTIVNAPLRIVSLVSGRCMANSSSIL